jgi:hypothetical protein
LISSETGSARFQKLQHVHVLWLQVGRSFLEQIKKDVVIGTILLYAFCYVTGDNSASKIKLK